MAALVAISYEATETILMKFHVMVIQDLAKTGNDPKFKMAVMTIYGKNHSNDFFFRTTGSVWGKFCRKHMGHLPI